MNNRTKPNDILNAISRAITQHKSIEEILNLSVQMIADFFKVELCNIYTYDNQVDKLILVATKGFDKSLIGQVALLPNEGLVGHTFTQQAVMQLISPHKSKYFYYVSGTDEEKFNSFMGFPILSHNRCWGVLTLQCIDKKVISPEDKDLVETLSSRLSALLIKNLEQFSIIKIPANKLTNLQGIAASSGVAFGTIYLYKSHLFWQNIVCQFSSDIEEELNHLDQAIESAKEETIQIQERATELFVEADASIFFSQLIFLEDQYFIEQIIDSIKLQKYTALSSVKIIVEKQIEFFAYQNNEQLSDRVIDLQDIGIRIAKHLQEDFVDENGPDINEDPFILVVDDLMPSDLINFKIKNILGIICRIGGVTSHAAILARSLNIPVVMSVADIFEVCQENDKALIDANEGIVYINPHKILLKQYNNINSAIDEVIDTSLDKPETTDGQFIKLQANINLSNELVLLEKIYNDGIGLYRSEFMFMVHDKFPSEAEQYRIYNWLANYSTKSITIRVLDIGGDKQLPYFEMNKDDASMLGWRSIRLLFDKREILIPHLRALLRVSQGGNVRILFPMVAHSQDMQIISDIVDEVLVDLSKQYNQKFKRPKIGAMIEIPSAVLQIKNIAKICDFVSVGTNDLLQYLFAVDRGNQKVRSYFAPTHPAILQALQNIIKTCKRLNKPVSLCGEMAGNPNSIPLLVGLGFTNLSMVPTSIPKIKKLIRKLDYSKCKKLVDEALLCSTSQQVDELIEQFLKQNS